MGWEVRVADRLAETPPPTTEELRLIREELDPAGCTRGSRAAVVGQPRGTTGHAPLDHR